MNLTEIQEGLARVLSHWHREAEEGIEGPVTRAIRGWLLAPTSANNASLVEALTKLKARSLEGENAAQLEAALHWLAFFDGHSDWHFERLLGELWPASLVEKPFETEYLYSLRELRVRCQTGEMSLDDDELSSPPPPGAMLQSLVALLRGTLVGGTEPFRIDMRRFEITTPSGRLRSEPACLAIELFHREPVVSFAEFLACTYRLGRYDPTLHETRIRNLVARLKRIFPELRIQTKEQRIYSETDWSRYRFIFPPAHERIRHHPAWRDLLASIEPAEPEKSVRQSRKVSIGLLRRRFKGEFRRVDVQALFGLSRSSVGRRLAEWTARGLVKPTGSGPRTTYTFVYPLETEAPRR